jgi:hypothetical protein
LSPLRLGQTLERLTRFALLLGFRIGAIVSGEVGAHAWNQRMFPHLVASMLMVNGEASSLQIGAQLAELARHATSRAVPTPMHSSTRPTHGSPSL